MKKFFLIITCLLLVALCFTACKSTTVDFNKELISNGTFEGKTTEGWTFASSENDTKVVKYGELGSDAASFKEVGNVYLKLDSVSDYANYRTNVAIEKNATYRLSAKIRIDSKITPDEEESGLCGAFLAIASDYNLVSVIRTEATSGWETIETYFNSGSRSDVDVVFGIGIADADGKGTDRFAQGSAWFDGISLMKVKPSESVFATDLSGSESGASFDVGYSINKSGSLFMILTAVLGALCLFAAYAAFRTMMGRKDAFLSPDSNQSVSFFKSSAFFLLICEVLAFAVRLILINFVYGGSTLYAGVSEVTKLLDQGGAAYYGAEKVTTPIGSLYLLWMLGALAKPLKLSIGSSGFAIFLKIPAILADLVAVFMIYYLANRKYNQYISGLFAGIYAIFPLFFLTSAGWGTYASIGALFLLLSLSSVVDKKYVMSIVYMAIALLFSTEVMLVLPLFLIYLGFVFFKSDDYKTGISVALTASIIGLYLISIPFILTRFTAGQPFIVFINYCQAFLAHTGFTENSFTIYGLFALGAKTATTVSYVFNGILVGLMMIYTICLFFKSRSRLDLLLLFAFTFVFTFVMTSAVDILLIYPALVLLLVYGFMTGDRRVLKLFGGLSLTTLVNTSYAMNIGGYFGSNGEKVFMTATDPVLIVFSALNLLLLAYFAYITASICIKDEVKGVVIVEGNYFKFAWNRIKACGRAIAVFFTVTIPSWFKKEKKEETDAR